MAHDTRPNIIMVVVHDIGRMLSSYGTDPLLRTPHLDHFAAEGVRFASHFSCAAFCSPSRGALITGKYPHVTGLMGLTNLGWDLPAGNLTVARALGAAGYDTALIGLQHEAKDPLRLGFDHVSDRSLSTKSEVVTPLAVEWLESREPAAARPFYLQIGFADVHRPYPDASCGYETCDTVRPLPYLSDTPGHREDLLDLYSSVEHMDQNVGRILNTLEQQRLRDNTWVIFTTDHGLPFPRAKGTMYDAGIGVGMLMRWPQGFAGGQTINSLTSHVDVLPSLLQAAGASDPGDLQGRSLLPLLRGVSARIHDFIFAELNTSPWFLSRCIRTETHKYIRNYTTGTLRCFATDIERSKTRRDMAPPQYWDVVPEELYDVRLDPCEQTNLIGMAAAQPLHADLSTTLDRVMADTCDPLLSGELRRPADEAEILAKAFAAVARDLASSPHDPQ